ncbi:MAG TPA: hypothetical protein VEV83_16135 [Parafilimonas sp.]|nr:hypothetical protein [Parafilimonas sp.]
MYGFYDANDEDKEGYLRLSFAGDREFDKLFVLIGRTVVLT